jgi:hypothetical protein
LSKLEEVLELNKLEVIGQRFVAQEPLKDMNSNFSRWHDQEIELPDLEVSGALST